MLLGKKFTRIKRSLNAGEYYVQFVTDQGKRIRLPRKLNMLALQYSCLENSTDRGLVGYNPWGQKELEMTERLTHNYCGLKIIHV